MMKRLLLIAAVFMAGTVMSFAQFANIGLLGGSTVTGWDSDTDMVTTDGVVYTLNDVVITVPETDGGVKFRQDDAWTTNWGGNGFPSGTASLNGANIPAVNGTYNVTFNLTTLEYNFVNTGFDEVTLEGEGASVVFSSTDGINYNANNATFPETTVVFHIDDTGTGWGSASFPTGTATEGGAGIPVAANSYNVWFNLETGEYSFNFVTISLIGAGVVDWDTDTDLATEDGVNYTLSNFTFPGGEAKFRLNHDWNPGWGSADFPSGTASTAGDAPNIPVVAGTYDVAFNRETGVYSFNEPSAGTKEFDKNLVSVYPNPAQNVWNFTAGSAVISNIQIADVSGKIVYSNMANDAEVVVQAGSFAAGMYFAKITAGTVQQTIKIIKK
jgi:hypothetical protein